MTVGNWFKKTELLLDITDSTIHISGQKNYYHPTSVHLCF